MGAELLRPQEPEQPKERRLFPEQRLQLLTEEEFPPESLGREYVRSLEGRERRMAVVLQGVEKLSVLSKPNWKPRSKVVSSGFSRIYDLLCLTPQGLEAWAWGNKIKGALDEFFDKLKIAQEQQLFKAIFGKDYIPQSLTPQQERELHGAVVGALNTLKQRNAEILKFRFGINDGVSHTLEEIGRHFGVTRSHICQAVARNLQILRHPSRSEKLREYLNLPPNSLAHSLFGLNFEGDLKPLAGIPLSKLSPGVRGLVSYVAEKSRVFWLDLLALLKSDSNLFFENLSPRQIEDLKGEILSVYEKAQAGSYLVPEEPLPLREYTNRLLPELRLDRKLLQMLRNQPVNEIFSKSNLDIRTRNTLWRNQINTIGQLLNLTDSELFQMRQVGRVSLDHLKSRLREYIEETSLSLGAGAVTGMESDGDRTPKGWTR